MFPSRPPPISLTDKPRHVGIFENPKMKATAWQKRRRPVGVLVSRNRALCALEGAEWSLLR